MKPGRPRLDPNSTQPAASVHLKLSAADYDRAEKLRQANRDKSIQDVIRRGLKKLIDGQ